MYFATAALLIPLVLASSVSAAGAVICNYTKNCAKQTGCTSVPSNNGQCWGQDVNAWTKVSSTDPGCSVTYYTDGNCSKNKQSAPIGKCFNGIGSFSVDC